MEKKRVIQITAGTPPPDEKDVEKFYRWLDEIHVPNLFKFKGLKRATNYRLIDADHPYNTEGVEYPEYITIFEFDSKQDYDDMLASPEIEYAVGVGKDTWGETTGRKKVWLATYEESKRFER